MSDDDILATNAIKAAEALKQGDHATVSRLYNATLAVSGSISPGRIQKIFREAGADLGELPTRIVGRPQSMLRVTRG